MQSVFRFSAPFRSDRNRGLTVYSTDGTASYMNLTLNGYTSSDFKGILSTGREEVLAKSERDVEYNVQFSVSEKPLYCPYLSSLLLIYLWTSLITCYECNFFLT